MKPDAKMTRRRLLQTAAQMAALTAAASVFPPGLRKALAASVPPGSSLKDIKHVVLLMMENRSFDHYFGTMAGVRGFADAGAIVQENGRSIFYQPDEKNPDGYLLPFHLDTKKTNAQKMPSTSHAWDVQHASWNGGAMDGWLRAHRKVDKEKAPYVMGYFRRDDIPFHFALAEAFTVCDAYHSSVMGPTHPNRMHWMTGTIDADGQNGGPMIKNFADGQKHLKWTTYAERLEAAGVSWKVYQDNNDYECNMLAFFENFARAPKESPLYQKAMPNNPGQFEDDVKNDRLPAVSWIIPSEINCEHPDGLPAAGADFMAGKIEAIAANPDVWAKTAFILCYDENDGLFDHVAPPVPPAGTPGEFVEGLPIGGGFRVPCIVISPWTVGGWVCSEPFDHTSVLRFLEVFTGVREPNISDWRRQTFGDLTSVFRFGESASVAPALPATADLLKQAQAEAAQLPSPIFPLAEQSFPVQEPGALRRV